MSNNTVHHKFFDKLVIYEDGSCSCGIYFPPTNSKIQILFPLFEGDINIPDGCEMFFKELVSLYSEISIKTQGKLFELRDEFEEMLSIVDVWKIFQLESVMIDDTKLDESNYWSLIYGTDYGGHIIDFEMVGRNISDWGLDG